MEELTNLPIDKIVLTLNFLLTIILFLMVLGNSSKIKKLKMKYNNFMDGVSGGRIEDMLNEYLDKAKTVSAKNRELENRINDMERNLFCCVQKVGVVRFNAFDDVGSDLSFSIALLNYNDDGVVFSGLYSRDSSTTYAKPIIGGKSKYALSVEELQAIDIARKTHRNVKYTE